MVDFEENKESVKSEVIGLMPHLVEMSDWIGRHPELGSEEYESSKLLMEELEKHGFQVERGFQGMETAFKAPGGEHRLRRCHPRGPWHPPHDRHPRHRYSDA